MRTSPGLAITATVLGLLLPEMQLFAQEVSFPHGTHSAFFPECSACHTGMTASDPAGFYPDLATCTACHDGSMAPAIQWETPEARASSLDFTHAAHGFDCATCHTQAEEAPTGMSFPDPETCIGCHAPGANHKEAEDCGFCHAKVTDISLTGFGLEPAFHEPGFRTSHASAASSGQPDCASCHSENTCTQCHDGLGSPDFHPINFLASHGPEAFGRVSDCTTCHNNQSFCRECHLNLGFNQEGPLFSSFHDDQGVGFFSHSFAARQDLESCVSCHQQTDCMRCHSSRTGLGVNPHGPGFDASSLFDLNRETCELCHGGA